MSARTVKLHVECMVKNFNHKIKNDLLFSEMTSIALDESTDISSMDRLAIIIWLTLINNSTVNEQLCISRFNQWHDQRHRYFSKSLKFKKWASITFKNK